MMPLTISCSVSLVTRSIRPWYSMAIVLYAWICICRATAGRLSRSRYSILTLSDAYWYSGSRSLNRGKSPSRAKTVIFNGPFRPSNTFFACGDSVYSREAVRSQRLCSRVEM